jgi:hypothetical protein
LHGFVTLQVQRFGPKLPGSGILLGRVAQEAHLFLLDAELAQEVKVLLRELSG